MKLKNMNSTQRMMRIMLIGLIALLTASGLVAQVSVATASPFYKPGDVVRLSVTFDGPDLETIQAVQTSIVRNFAEPEKAQFGFETNITGVDSKRVSRNTFEVGARVTDSTASGEYRLYQIRVFYKSPRPSVSYTVDVDFKQKLLFRIKNDKHFENPTVTSITELR